MRRCISRPDRSASGRSSFPALAALGGRHADTNHEEACMAKADKATAVADIAEQFKDSTATVDHRVPRADGRQPGRAAPVARRLRHLHGRQEHAGQACRVGGGHRGPRRAVRRPDGDRVRHAASRSTPPRRIKTFAKDHKALVIKGGYMDGRALTVSEVERIADLESREVLLAKLAGAMKAQPVQGRRPVQRSRVAGRPAGCRAAGEEGRRSSRRSRRRGSRRSSAEPPKQPAAEPSRSRITHTPKPRNQEGPTPWPSCPPTNCSTRSRN